MLQQAAGTIPFYVKGERSGGGKLSQGAIDTANQFIAEGDEVVETKVMFMEATVPGLKVTRDASGSVNVESLARAIQTFTQHYKREAAKTAANVLSK